MGLKKNNFLKVYFMHSAGLLVGAICCHNQSPTKGCAMARSPLLIPEPHPSFCCCCIFNCFPSMKRKEKK